MTAYVLGTSFVPSTGSVGKDVEGAAVSLWINALFMWNSLEQPIVSDSLLFWSTERGRMRVVGVER